MATYKLLRDVWLNDDIRSTGTVQDIKDAELAKKLLENGSIEAVNGGSESNAPLAPTPPASGLSQEVPAPPVAPVVEQPAAPVNHQQPTPEQINETLSSVLPQDSQASSSEQAQG